MISPKIVVFVFEFVFLLYYISDALDTNYCNCMFYSFCCSFKHMQLLFKVTITRHLYDEH